MPLDFIILVNGGFGIEQLVNYMELFLGLRFEKNEEVEWNLYQAEAVRLYLSVYDHEFENNLGIEFERFPFAIDMQGMRNLQTNAYYVEWLKLFPLLVGSSLSRELNCECLVVENMQHIIKSFAPGGQNEASRP